MLRTWKEYQNLLRPTGSSGNLVALRIFPGALDNFMNNIRDS